MLEEIIELLELCEFSAESLVKVLIDIADFSELLLFSMVLMLVVSVVLDASI